MFLKLCGISDIYQHFGHIYNILQIVEFFHMSNLTGLKLGQLFFESARKLTGSISMISGIETKENFLMFLKVLEQINYW